MFGWLCRSDDAQGKADREDEGSPSDAGKSIAVQMRFQTKSLEAQVIHYFFLKVLVETGATRLCALLTHLLIRSRSGKVTIVDGAGTPISYICHL